MVLRFPKENKQAVNVLKLVCYKHFSRSDTDANGDNCIKRVSVKIHL